MAKVNFIGIGAQKAATTWLHNVLSEHTTVTTSACKELNFFTANFDRGYTWYENSFANNSDITIRGECSPNYFLSRDAAQRAWEYNQNLKIICILRDPIERAFSNHLHEIRKGHIEPATSFEAALSQNPAYVQQSQYKTNLEIWLKYFKRDAFLILFSEEIMVRPEEAYFAICSHLKISPEENLKSVWERHNESNTFKFIRFQGILRYFGDLMRSLGMPGLVRSLKQLPGLEKALTLNKQHLKDQVAPPTLETRNMLVSKFEQDLEFVAEITDREQLPWPTWRDQFLNTDTVRR